MEKVKNSQPLLQVKTHRSHFVPIHTCPVGAMLCGFVQVWVESIEDHFWEFFKNPRSIFVPTAFPCDLKREVLFQYVDTLLHWKLIEEVSQGEHFLGVYSPLFLVQ